MNKADVKILGLGLALGVSALGIHACSSNSSSSELGGLSQSAISSPFGISTSTSSSLSTSTKRIFPASYSDRKAAIAAIVDASDKESCVFDIDVSAPTNNDKYADCYGPNLLFETGPHEDGSFPAAPSAGNPSNPLPTGDLGIWNSSSSDGSACTAAQITKLVDSQTKYAYQTQLIGAALYCFANNSGILPTGTATTTLDATQLTDFGFTKGSKVFTPTSATVTGITDSGGNPGYRFDVSGTVDGITFTAKVQYAYQSDEGYSGTATYVFRFPSQDTQGCTGGSGSSYAGRMTFSRADTSSDVMTKLDQAVWCGTTYDMFTLESGTDIDPCDKKGQTYNSDSSNGWTADWNRVVFNYDPDTLVGKYSYAWMAGNQDSWTRVFNAKITDATTGAGYFGFGPDVGEISGGGTTCTKSADLGKITKMICNWAGPSSIHANRQTSDYVQYQPMTKSAAGVWTVTTSGEKITYAPTNSCDASSSTSLRYCAVSNNNSTTCPSTSMSNDYKNGGTAPSPRNNLDALSNYSSAWTAPTSPTF